MLDFTNPLFWRHLAAAVLGAAFVAVPIYLPPLAPLAPVLAPIGIGMLGAAGTRLLGPAGPPLLPPRVRTGTTPPQGRPAA